MAGAEFRIFLSAVTSEFGRARSALAADLRSRGLLVRVQEDFRQEARADTTLRKLHDYIRDCAAVICIIGTRSGACPPLAAAAPFVHMLPPGISEASYTQWEFFFAQRYRRRFSIYIATGDYRPDQPEPNGPDCPDLQQALMRHIVEEKGLDRSYFSNEDQLCRAVLKEDWDPAAMPADGTSTVFPGTLTDITKAVREVISALGDLAKLFSGAIDLYDHRKARSAAGDLYRISFTPDGMRQPLERIAAGQGTPEDFARIATQLERTAEANKASIRALSGFRSRLRETRGWSAVEKLDGVILESSCEHARAALRDLVRLGAQEPHDPASIQAAAQIAIGHIGRLNTELGELHDLILPPKMLDHRMRPVTV